MEKTNISGLKSSEVQALHQQFGFNVIEQKKENKWQLWLKQFWGPLPWLLELVAILSFSSNNIVEAIIILALLIANGFISVIQRSKTDTALNQLRSSLQTSTRVKRDGEWIVVLTRDLVPGDLVRLRAGDIISADMHLVDGSISVDQSSITGESLPVNLDQKGDIYSGSVLVRGEATAIVDAIGAKTKYGTTAELLETSHPPTHMEKIIFTIIKYQFGFNIVLILLIISYILISHQSFHDAIPLVIVLLITSVPIAFPTMFTVAQTFGASQLAHLNNNQGILVRRLAAVQDCATMNVLCTDKTGTLTKNSLSISQIITYQDFSEDEVLALAAACSNLSDQDPIDKAVLERAKKLTTKPIPHNDFIPFDPLTKQTQASVNYQGQPQIILKGLPEVITKETLKLPTNYHSDLSSLNQKGYRTIAVSLGIKKDQQKIIGLIAFEDPIRDDSKDMLDQLINMGISIKMITGDNLETAKTIANQLGFKVKACTTAMLNSDPSLALTHNVFAEAYPKDKLLIISELQKHGCTVGMTGDGVNDSPALHQAEVGIAVANASDIAKSSASYILVNPGLKDIVIAVKTSREVYQRIRTWALNKVLKSFEIAMLSVIGYLLTRNVLLSPLLAVLFLFANDFVTISIATDRSIAEPRPANWQLFKLIFSSVSLSVVLLILLAGSLIFAREGLHLPYSELATLTFILLVFQGQASLYSLRSWPHFWSIRPSKTLFIATVSVWAILILAAFLGIIIHRIPLDTIWLIIILPLASLLLTDLTKRFLPVSDRI